MNHIMLLAPYKNATDTKLYKTIFPKPAYLSNMFMKPLLFCMVLLAVAGNGYAQKSDFCNAVVAILRDAPNEFRNVHAPTPGQSNGNLIYAPSINVPGCTAARFIKAMSFVYQGALKQSAKLEDIKDAYEQYKNQLNTCLEPKGYAMRLTPNFTKGLEDYKKALYMPDFKKAGEETPPAGHVAMEVDYNKDSRLYTLLLFIYAK